MDTKETNIILVSERSSVVVGNNGLVNWTSVAGKVLETQSWDHKICGEVCFDKKLPSEGISLVQKG